MIYHEDLNQPVKVYIVEDNGYFTKYAKCCKDAKVSLIDYKESEVTGMHAEQGFEEPIICISIENFDF